MDRMEKFGSVAMALLVGMQIWTLYRVEKLTSSETEVLHSYTEHSKEATRATTHFDPAQTSTNIQNQYALLSALKRIDARLTAIELSTHQGRSKQEMSPTRYDPTISERTAADQRLNSLLPSGPLSREDYARLNADIQALPSDERFAVATALSRAINEGRVQMTPGAM